MQIYVTRTRKLQELDIQEYLKKDAERSAQIDNYPLFRLQLFQTGETSYVFVLSIQHLIHDAWSLAIMLSEFMELYSSQIEKTEPGLPSCSDYKSYISWLKNKNFEKGLEFWRNSLNNFNEKVQSRDKNRHVLNSISKNPTIETSDVFGKKEYFLSFETSKSIIDLSKTESITPNIFFQSVWAVLYSHLIASEKVVFGITVTGRPAKLSGVETIVGNFINTLPLGVEVNLPERLMDLRKNLQSQQSQASLFEFIPLTRIAAACGRKKGEELFETIFVYQNFAREFKKKSASGLHFDTFRTFGHPNYPLTLRITPGTEFFIEFLYDERIYLPKIISEIAATFIDLCNAAAKMKKITVEDLFTKINKISKEKRKTEKENKQTLFSQKLDLLKSKSVVAEKK